MDPVLRPRALPCRARRPARRGPQQTARRRHDGSPRRQHDGAPRRRLRAAAHPAGHRVLGALRWLMGLDALLGVCRRAPRAGACPRDLGGRHDASARGRLADPHDGAGLSRGVRRTARGTAARHRPHERAPRGAPPPRRRRPGRGRRRGSRLVRDRFAESPPRRARAARPTGGPRRAARATTRAVLATRA